MRPSAHSIVFALLAVVTTAIPGWASPIVTQLVRFPIADAQDLRFLHLSSTQGMTSTRVRLIMQDDGGFIWFGSEFGLDRYDGYRFKLFAHDPNRVNSLGGTHVNALFKDRAGFLWIDNDQTLDKFDTKTETFTHYQLQAPGAAANPAGVANISQDHEGTIWLATGAGLLGLNPASGAIQHFQHDPGNSRGLTSDEVKFTFEDRKHRFWIVTSAGLDEFDRHTGAVVRHVPLVQQIREALLYEDHAGQLWLGCASGDGAGLSMFDPETNVLSHYRFNDEDASAVSYSGVYSIAEDHEGNLWIGTGGMGLLRLDRTGHKFVRYRNDPTNPESLSDDHITAMLVDREGHLWVGSNSTGPNITDLRPPLFRHVLHSLGSHGGGEALIYSIFQDRGGGFWTGTASGLFRLDPQRGTVRFVDTSGGAAEYRHRLDRGR